MPKQKSGTYDHKAYQNEYHKAMKTKVLSFNQNSADDMVLWTHLMAQANATGYIKDLIRKDIAEKQKTLGEAAQGME
jgi:hypothetical protein